MGNDSPAIVTDPGRRRDRGFTLVEILIAIVLVGILAAVVAAGVGDRTEEEGSSSACTASLDASRAPTATTGVAPTSTCAAPPMPGGTLVIDTWHVRGDTTAGQRRT